MSTQITICIPAYKNVSYLKRLLDSIAQQTYKSYDVVITDDSPNDEVAQLLESYYDRIADIQYRRNQPAKGMPENWNTAIANAKGEWIKIMHDDDWFLIPDALEQFACKTTTEADFICSNYRNFYLDSSGQARGTKSMVFAKDKVAEVAKEPLVLLADNIIGPPSVCMVRKSVEARYDPRLRWRVDIDYYKTVLSKKGKIELIEKELIGVGMNDNQVTNETKNIPAVELPEAYILLQKYGLVPLDNWVIYDSWWRMFRNMQIYSYAQLQQYVKQSWPEVIIHMLQFMEKLPKFLLKFGPSSKICMFMAYARGRALIYKDVDN